MAKAYNADDQQGWYCHPVSIGSESGEMNSPLGTSVLHQDQLVDLPLLLMFKH